MAHFRSNAVATLLKLAEDAPQSALPPETHAAIKAAWEAFCEEDVTLSNAEGKVIATLMLRVEGLL